MNPTPDPRAKLLRQKRLATLLAILLIIGGAVLLFLLRRVPAPLRIMAGLTDVAIGCVLLVRVRRLGP